tara:strand:+ start:81 stop:308 length:228 start_codon:yes stop_codon:yes gene_type:complete
MKRKSQILKEIKNLVMEYKSINERSEIPKFKKAIDKTIKSIEHTKVGDSENVDITLSDGSMMSFTSEYIDFGYYK